MITRQLVKLASIALLTLGGGVASAQQSAMTFFVTSTGSGKGADFGGLGGADKHCQTLAAAVGAGKHTWRAYLSASPTGTLPAVDARDRIGKGPWQNAKGVVIARDVAELHGKNNLDKKTALQQARHPHRVEARWHCLYGFGGNDLRQLDQERRRCGDARPPRPAGPA